MAVQRNYLISDIVEGEDLEDEEEESNGNSPYQMDFSLEEALANNPDQLINHLDILLANGLLSSNTKAIIKSTIEQLNSPADRVRMATYLIMISPDYAIHLKINIFHVFNVSSLKN